VNASAQCKNCGAVLAGEYCATCGQPADVSIPSVAKLLVDALGDLYNFDSRLWRSLALLLFRPGRLTREYLEGRRARYSPPFRMYVVMSLVFFFLVAALPEDSDEDEDLRTALSALETEIDARAPPHDEGAAEPGVPAPEGAAGAEVAPPPVVAEREPQVGIGTWTGEGVDGWNCNSGDIEDWDPVVRDRVVRACEAIAADKGNSFARALVENIPLMMFLFIPIVAAGMKVLYPFARRKYVEHGVLPISRVLFLLAAVGISLSSLAGIVPVLNVPVVLLWVAGWIYLPMYLFVAMRRVYAQGRLATAFKYVLLGGGYFFALVCTLLGIVVYTALTL
jgi:hypothetical protein